MDDERDPEDDEPRDRPVDADPDDADPDEDDPNDDDPDDDDPYPLSDLDFASAFMLCAREPFEEWVRGVEGLGPDWTLPLLSRCTAFITPELPRQEDADSWLQRHYAELFERQLEPWTDDEAQWPSDRSFETFLAWFDVVFSPNVDDLRDAHLPERTATCDPLSLRKVLAEFSRLSPDGSLYVDIATGELFAWTDDELTAIHAGDAERFGVPPEDMRELQEVFASESLVEIGHHADIDNVGTMLEFARTVESPTIQHRLMNALDSKKWPRRFAEAVDVAGLRHRWSAFREQVTLVMLRAFLDARGVPFVDDLGADAEEAPPRE
jgi:hypothetical protein